MRCNQLAQGHTQVEHPTKPSGVRFILSQYPSALTQFLAGDGPMGISKKADPLVLVLLVLISMALAPRLYHFQLCTGTKSREKHTAPFKGLISPFFATAVRPAQLCRSSTCLLLFPTSLHYLIENSSAHLTSPQQGPPAIWPHLHASSQ
ncbi:hypothetical protein Baya_2931 [Bagarius yarrelli]|uniref:Uncharacterized protein n=1 Tax=Bagarius yarrelli TaxID=175774 RepID=A0A556TQZ0_BAGYA|nr:hypothetical protein Baya_2931 [Bagarius yarrelli]